MRSAPSSKRDQSRLELRAALGKLLDGAGLSRPAGWSRAALGEWLRHDTTGRAAAMAPLLLAVSDDAGGALPPALFEPARRLLALVRWVPPDPVWGGKQVVTTLDALVECLGGAAALAELGRQIGTAAEDAWLPPDGEASAKALITLAHAISTPAFASRPGAGDRHRQ